MIQRLAIFSDVHGNLPALDAVLDDIDRSGIAALYCLGDLVGYGPDPAGVVGRIRSLGIPTIRGNYDDGIGNTRGDCGCYYATDEARADGAVSYSFTDAALNDHDHAWLAALPDEIRLEIGGRRILLAHGSPRRINEYLLMDRSDQQLARLADDAEADVVCVGHVHIPYCRTLIGGDGRPVHYISSGSVGKPKDGDPRAGWVELGISDAGDVEYRAHRVEYDVETVAQQMTAAGLPARLVQALRNG